MYRTKALITVILLIPLMSFAANAFIWLYDPGDRFDDPETGTTIDCAYWIEQALAANGHDYTTGDYLPADLSPYDVVFVTLGFFRC